MTEKKSIFLNNLAAVMAIMASIAVASYVLGTQLGKIKEENKYFRKAITELMEFKNTGPRCTDADCSRIEGRIDNLSLRVGELPPELFMEQYRDFKSMIWAEMQNMKQQGVLLTTEINELKNSVNQLTAKLKDRYP